MLGTDCDSSFVDGDAAAGGAGRVGITPAGGGPRVAAAVEELGAGALSSDLVMDDDDALAANGKVRPPNMILPRLEKDKSPRSSHRLSSGIGVEMGTNSLSDDVGVGWSETGLPLC